MKKRTKAKKQKLNNLLVLLVLAAVLLIMSTYAWFTANRTVNIEAIDVRVATSSGLQISADGLEWKTILTRKDLEDAHTTYAAAVNQMPDNMAPVSTTLDVAGNRMKMFYGNVTAELDPESANYGEYVLRSVAQTDTPSETVVADTGEYAKGYYVAFDIFLKSGNTEENLYMSGSAVEQKKGEDNSFVAVSEENKKGIENAARIALIPGENTTSEDKDTIQGLKTEGIAGKALMWEPNSDAHTTHGVENATTLGWGGSLSAGVRNPYVDYDGVMSEFSTPVLLKDATAAKDATKFSPVVPTWKTEKGAVVNNAMPKSYDGNALLSGVTKYRIYMWVEGQDVDCENFASGTYLQYDLSFSLDEYTE